MFKCIECDHHFDEPERIEEMEYADYGIGGQWLPAYVTNVCPNCGSEDYEEASDEDDDVTEQDETLGVGLQQAEGTADDGARVA